MIFGSQLFRPWFTKKTATAIASTRRMTGLRVRATAPARSVLPTVGSGCGVEESTRAVNSSHRTQTAPVTAANTSGTLRQLPPAAGTMTLLAAARATACPTTGPVT